MNHSLILWPGLVSIASGIATLTDDSGNAITSDTGSVIVVPYYQNIELREGYSFGISSGSVSLSGNAVPFTRQGKISASPESVVVGMSSSNLLKGSVIGASSSEFVLSGDDITLSKSSAVAKTINVESGSVSVSGSIVSTTCKRSILSVCGTVLVSGSDVDISAARVSRINSGVVLISGNEIVLLPDRFAAADYGSVSVSGDDVGARATRYISIDRYDAVLSGSSANLLKQRPGFLDIEPAAISVNGSPVLLNKISPRNNVIYINRDADVVYANKNTDVYCSPKEDRIAA